jgi:release factor glutamine methyltransferase
MTHFSRLQPSPNLSSVAAESGLSLEPIPAAIKIRQKIRPLLFRLLYPLHMYFNRDSRQTRVNGLSLRVEPQVFDPGRHFSSKILARNLRQLELANCRLLDMGTGSGIIGIIAAQKGANVTAVDINPAASQVATANAQTLQVTDKMRVCCGDLFAPIQDATPFDWIVFNPPFFPRSTTRSLEAAYNAGDDYATITRFLQQAKNFLAPSGRILLILSSDMNLFELQAMFHHHKYRVAHCEIKPHLFEQFYLVQLRSVHNSTSSS